MGSNDPCNFLLVKLDEDEHKKVQKRFTKDTGKPASNIFNVREFTGYIIFYINQAQELFRSFLSSYNNNNLNY